MEFIPWSSLFEYFIKMLGVIGGISFTLTVMTHFSIWRALKIPWTGTDQGNQHKNSDSEKALNLRWKEAFDTIFRVMKVFVHILAVAGLGIVIAKISSLFIDLSPLAKFILSEYYAYRDFTWRVFSFGLQFHQGQIGWLTMGGLMNLLVFSSITKYDKNALITRLHGKFYALLGTREDFNSQSFSKKFFNIFRTSFFVALSMSIMLILIVILAAILGLAEHFALTGSIPVNVNAFPEFPDAIKVSYMISITGTAALYLSMFLGRFSLRKLFTRVFESMLWGGFIVLVGLSVEKL